MGQLNFTRLTLPAPFCATSQRHWSSYLRPPYLHTASVRRTSHCISHSLSCHTLPASVSAHCHHQGRTVAFPTAESTLFPAAPLSHQPGRAELQRQLTDTQRSLAWTSRTTKNMKNKAWQTEQPGSPHLQYSRQHSRSQQGKPSIPCICKPKCLHLALPKVC